ncbi:hypothetical protein evm_007588 [Chilo suppressalis]|nr:hypothetical protein evm_007588 [Chilo suppressalis]
MSWTYKTRYSPRRLPRRQWILRVQAEHLPILAERGSVLGATFLKELMLPGGRAFPNRANTEPRPALGATRLVALMKTKREREASPVDDSLAAKKQKGTEKVEDLLQRLVSTGLLKVPKALHVEKTAKPQGGSEGIIPVDLENPESLKTAQPGLVEQLYAGKQCSGCSTRFPTKETGRYSQHLDWHFRQNRRDRTAKRIAQSRPWHYTRSDWLQFEEVEDQDVKQKSWFEAVAVKKAEVKPVVVPSVKAGALADDNCALCGDKFELFYHDDDDEWHLKDSVRYEDKNYHPECLDCVNKITTVLTPPATPSPTTSVDTPSPGGASSHPRGAGLSVRRDLPQGADAAWWQSVPESRQHGAPSRTRCHPPSCTYETKREREASPVDDSLAAKKQKGTEKVEDLLQRLVSTGLLKVPKALHVEKTAKPQGGSEGIIPVDLENPESLKTAQPGLVEQLYAGKQCSGCSTRFPTKETGRYSQHLDWHFRQNRRDRTAKRIAQSRPWHYTRSDWLQFEEVEDQDVKQKSWFEAVAVKKAEVKPVVVPSVKAGALADDNCALCGDKFELFYHDDDDEWHLKDSVRYEDKNYHPECLDCVNKRQSGTS